MKIFLYSTLLGVMLSAGVTARAGVVGTFTAGGAVSTSFAGVAGQSSIGRSGDGTQRRGLIVDISVPLATSGALISEFRLHGSTSSDEYVEVANATNGLLNIGGWSLDYEGIGAVVRIPANTVLPRGGRLLFRGTDYTPSTYSAGDVVMTGDAAGDSGVALRNASGQTVDAAGFTTSSEERREGAGLAFNGAVSAQHAWVRDQGNLVLKDSGANTTSLDGKGNNASDFLLVSTAASAGSTLGAPGPQNTSSPLQPLAGLTVSVLDAGAGATAPPNRVRLPSDAAGTAGALLIRRKITNRSGAPITRLRFRVVRLTTLGNSSAPGADVRLRSSGDETGAGGVTLSNSSKVDVFGTTLEAPAPLAQSLGGGLNSSVVDGTLSLDAPLPSGQSRNYSFKLGVERTGPFNVVLIVEGIAG